MNMYQPEGFKQLEKFGLEPVYRMPATLGPAPGPRNMPKDKMHLRFAGDTTIYNMSAISDEAALMRLLPSGCRLLDGPVLDINIIVQTNLGWLAGRGYNYLTVRIPVIYDHQGIDIPCAFMPVLWENLADPIITGRDELGSPKLYANIPDPGSIGDAYEGSADWEGFRFFEMRVSNLRRMQESPPAGLPLLLYRYLVRTGDWGKADVAQIVKSNRGQAPAPVIHEYSVGDATFKFHHARWEDMPTQYTFVNTLADLPTLQFRAARIVKMSGIADLAAYEILNEQTT
jgi:hypothetical protein